MALRTNYKPPIHNLERWVKKSEVNVRLTCWLVAGLLLVPREARGQVRVDGNWSPWSTIGGYCVQPSNRWVPYPCSQPMGGYDTPAVSQ
jgi:hypothetical protein